MVFPVCINQEFNFNQFSLIMSQSISIQGCHIKNCQLQHSIFDTKISNISKNIYEFKKIIQENNYTYIEMISQERMIFAAIGQKDTVSAVQLIEIDKEKKNSLMVNLNISLFLKKNLQRFFSMKEWKIESKTFLKDQKLTQGLFMIEYNLAQISMRHFIEEKRKENKKIQSEEMYRIFSQLIQCLFIYQLENTVIWDIRPQTIVFQNGKWFILEGQNAESNRLQYGQMINKTSPLKPIQKIYSSPLIYQAFSKSQSSVSHNPFKSDVFSLGLVIFQLQTIGIYSEAQFKQRVLNRKNLHSELNNFSLDFRQKYIIKGKKILELPNMLRVMLAQKQQERFYPFEICLILNKSHLIMNKIIVPFQNYFKKEVTHIEKNKHKITYMHVPHQYQGQLKQENQTQNEIIKEGHGSIQYNFVKIYQGEWKNNLPDGKCTIYFGESWKYQGMLKMGKFHGQGYLFYNGVRQSQGNWIENLLEAKLDKEINPQEGYYLFVEQEQNEFKVYFKKLNGCKSLILNLYYLDPKLIINNLIKFFKNKIITSIKLREKINQQILNIEEFDKLEFSTGEGQKVQLILDKNKAKSILTKMLQCNIFSVCPLSIDFSNTSISQDELRYILDKQISIQKLLLSNCKNIADKGLRIISISQNVKAIKVLDLSKLDVSDKGLHQLLFAKGLTCLEQIVFNFCQNISTEKMLNFLCQHKFRTLKKIQVQGTAFNHHSLQKFIKFNQIERLQKLNIGLCHKINDFMFSHFLKTDLSRNLKELILNSTIFSDNILYSMADVQCKIEGIQLINFSGSINLTFFGFQKLFSNKDKKLHNMNPKVVSKIRSLNFSSTYIDDQFLKMIAKSHIFEQPLQELLLSGCFAITDRGIQQLLRSVNFSSLQYLDISKTYTSNDSLFSMAQTSPTKFFKYINVQKCTKMNDSGFQRLVLSQSFKEVVKLDLSCCGVESGLFVSLSNSRNVGKLKQLIMNKCSKINELELINYVRSPNFKTLSRLQLNDTMITNNTLSHINQNSLDFYHFLNLQIKNCKNLNQKGYQKICIANKFIPLIKRKDTLRTESIYELAHSEILLKMNDLTLNNFHQEDQFKHIFNSIYAVNLNTLNITWSCLTSCFQSLSKSEYVKKIKHICLKGSQINQADFKLFLKSENVKHLQSLDISWTLLDNSILYSICQSQHLHYLKQLKMAKCIKINDKGMERLFMSKKCKILKNLDIRCTLVTNHTLESIAYSSQLKNLKRLNIRSCINLKEQGIQSLFKTNNCLTLKYLDFSWTNLGNKIFKFMLNSGFLMQLKQVVFSGMKNISDRGIVEWLTAPNQHLNCLKKLDISWTTLTNETLYALINSKSLMVLQELNLDNNKKMTMKGLSKLFESKLMQKMKIIDLSQLQLSTSELINLLSNRMSRIEKIIICGVQNVRVDEIMKYFPERLLVYKDKK